jgi:hypothetical protein
VIKSIKWWSLVVLEDRINISKHIKMATSNILVRYLCSNCSTPFALEGDARRHIALTCCKQTYALPLIFEININPLDRAVGGRQCISEISGEICDVHSPVENVDSSQDDAALQEGSINHDAQLEGSFFLKITSKMLHYC